jgi:hypothetical protein
MLDEPSADVLRDLVLQTPPNLVQGGGLPRCPNCKAASWATRMRKLSLTERKRDLLDLFTKSAGDYLDGWFESAPIKAAFGFDGVVGNYASPVHARLGLCAAAPRVRRGERQEGRLGPRHRRHGRDHPGHGEGLPRAWAWRSAPAARRAEVLSRRAARPAWSPRQRATPEARVRGLQPQSQACCTGSWSTPRRCPPRLPASGSGAGAAAPAPSG